MEKIVALCKRRGFIFQSSEIYGGINGFWDYGPLGVELKRNLKNIWWEDVVRKRDDIVGLDAAIIMNPKVWEASGHVGGFSDPMCTCKQCKKHFRADQIYIVGFRKTDDVWKDIAQFQAQNVSMQQEAREAIAQAKTPDEKKAVVNEFNVLFQANLEQQHPELQKTVISGNREEAIEHAQLTKRERKHFGDLTVTLNIALTDIGKPWPSFLAPPVCPNCGGEITEPRQFDLMFKSYAGAMEDSAAVVYLRPETAQGIFVNYKNVLDTSRVRPPFGIAQIGKAFRNEINPRNFTFRSREFEQMEIEFFCHESEADKWYEYWRDARYKWYIDLGLTSSRLRLRDHETDELAHYAASCADIEYDFPFGISELEGVANRTDYDLKKHQEHSGKDMQFFDDQTKERYIPYVIEPSGGVDRAVLAFICEAYTEDEAPDDKGKMQKRVLMKFHPRLAPIKVAVFPLVKKEGMPEIARKIYDDVLASGMTCFYDEKGAIGRRYRRQDEAGTPFCITVDGQTLEDQTVTIRDRDSLKQDRIAVEKVDEYVRERIG
ncbi:MAG: glycine--tRNA ligase [Phycisphaerae bacterium]|nr:glycine--tRNA ligase [Phycisphaerae bacterium]